MGTAASYPIFTATRAFDYRHPDLSDLSIEEVATSLGRLFRWRGSSPVTVGQHSVAMARCASTDAVAQWCLLHDAAEILIGDAPSPLKALACMDGFRRAEARILNALAERFDLPLPLPGEVKRLDRRACRSEVEEFLPIALTTVKGVTPLPISLAPAWSPAKARREFLAQARTLDL